MSTDPTPLEGEEGIAVGPQGSILQWGYSYEPVTAHYYGDTESFAMQHVSHCDAHDEPLISLKLEHKDGFTTASLFHLGDLLMMRDQVTKMIEYVTKEQDGS